jgi:hypothetical protein
VSEPARKFAGELLRLNRGRLLNDARSELDTHLRTRGFPSTGIPTTRRLFVTWQRPTTRRVSVVGVLTQDDSGYVFRYVQNARSVEGFEPFAAFPEWTREYRSAELFPFSATG